MSPSKCLTSVIKEKKLREQRLSDRAKCDTNRSNNSHGFMMTKIKEGIF